MFDALKNYKNYIEKNQMLFESPEGPKAIITDDMEYNNFVTELLEGADPEQATTLKKLLDREREMILQESADLALGSSEGIAYAVSAFPMIVLTYSTPVLTDGVTLYSSNKPVMTVPRLKWVADIYNEQGDIENSIDFPTAMAEVRPGIKTVTLTQQYSNLFTVLAVSASEFRISKRNFLVTKVNATETDSTSTTHAHVVNVAYGIDARGNVYGEFKITDADGVEGTFLLTADFKADTGDLNWSVVTKDYTGASTFVFDSIEVKFRILGNGNNKAVVKVKPRNEAIDINMDVEDSFEISNIEEVVQDWKSLYNIDIYNQLSEMVRLQIDLNRDYDIADLLIAQEANMQAAGLYKQIDFNNLLAIAYENYTDLLRYIIPRILNVRERIAKLTRREANVLYAGTDAASLLKSMQDYAISLSGRKGEFGMSGTGIAEFTKMKIISSNAIPDNKIYVVVKGDTPSNAVILLSVYKPLYIIQETTNSLKKWFIKSRYSLDLVNDTNHLGCIELLNYDGIVG